MDPLHLVVAMAKDWTDPVVVRDAPDRVPHVIEQLIEHCEALKAERDSLMSARTDASRFQGILDELGGALGIRPPFDYGLLRDALLGCVRLERKAYEHFAKGDNKA